MLVLKICLFGSLSLVQLSVQVFGEDAAADEGDIPGLAAVLVVVLAPAIRILNLRNPHPQRSPKP